MASEKLYRDTLIKNEVCGAEPPGGRYNSTALRLNLVLSLTPSQEFILLCF